MPPVEDEKLSSGEDDDDGEPGPEREIVEMRYTVEANYAGWRLDKYLTQKIKRASRTRIQEIIENDLVFERKLKSSTTVWAGLTFTLRRNMLVEPTVPKVEALTENFIDEWLLVLDKPAGLPVHATARYHNNTVVGQLLEKYGPGFEASPAHRLDRETSGLLVCGRTRKASAYLAERFARSEVSKEYLAIVEGKPPEQFDVDAPIAEGTPLIRIAVRIDQVAGKPAQTHFEVIERFTRDQADFAVVRCVPRTGRQHQIRIHAQAAGYPLVGDKMYGPGPEYFDRFTKGTLDDAAWARLRLPRHALHASVMSFVHPGTRQLVRFESPLPADLQGFVTLS